MHELARERSKAFRIACLDFLCVEVEEVILRCNNLLRHRVTIVCGTKLYLLGIGSVLRTSPLYNLLLKSDVSGQVELRCGYCCAIDVTPEKSSTLVVSLVAGLHSNGRACKVSIDCCHKFCRTVLHVLQELGNWDVQLPTGKHILDHRGNFGYILVQERPRILHACSVGVQKRIALARGTSAYQDCSDFMVFKELLKVVLGQALHGANMGH